MSFILAHTVLPESENEAKFKQSLEKNERLADTAIYRPNLA